MYATPSNFGEYGSLKDSIRKLAKAIGQPVKLLKKPKDAFSFKKQFKAGKGVGRSLENVAVDLNPLDPYMKKLDEAGIKAGRKGNVVAKVLGRTGEKARENPIATTGIVYTAALGIGKALAAKGAAVAKGAGTAVSAAGGGGTAATGTVAAGTGATGTSLLSQTAAGMATASKAASLVGAGKQILSMNKEEPPVEEEIVEPIQASMLPMNKEVGIITMLASIGIGAYFILKNK